MARSGMELIITTMFLILYKNLTFYKKGNHGTEFLELQNYSHENVTTLCSCSVFLAVMNESVAPANTSVTDLMTQAPGL